MILANKEIASAAATQESAEAENALSTPIVTNRYW